MSLEKIITIAGRPGLFEIQTHTRTGVIAHELKTGKRVVTHAHEQFSGLKDIQLYTLGGEIPLAEVFKKVYEHCQAKPCAVSPKASSDELEAFFFEVVEDYDEDRVYPSDIKKIIQWYNLLLENSYFESTGSAEADTPAETPEDA
ncbi:MAG: DUF5606 domain-containing protein [Flavobacteriaceae bacterium]